MQLQGTLPPELAQLSLLERLDLSSNWLMGTIPATYTQTAWLNLRRTNFEHNQLHGDVPTAAISTDEPCDFVQPTLSETSQA